jgi:hypothetical protein
MLEGARDLAIAFNIGRAEEAIHRLKSGVGLDSSDLPHFVRIADLFLDVLEAYQWIAQTFQGAAGSVRPDALRLFQLVLPAVRDSMSEAPPADVFSELATTAGSIGAGQVVSAEQRDRFERALRQLASVATRQGIDALETKPAVASFSQLPKLALM